MPTSPERPPHSNAYDVINGAVTRLLIADPQNFSKHIEQSHGGALIIASDETMPRPSTYGEAYFSSSEQGTTFSLSGHIDFHPQEDLYDVSWQEELLDDVKNSLLGGGTIIFSKPFHRNTFYAQLDEKYLVRVALEEELTHCTIQLDTEEVPEEQSAGSPHDTHPKTSRSDLTRDFLVYWNTVLSSITLLFGPEQPTPFDISLSIPEVTTSASQRHLSKVRSSMPEIELLPDRQNVISFDDLGGATEAKQRLKTIAACIQRPELAKKYNVTPSSFLLHGPAGTGKTSLVRAFAHEIGAELRECSPSQILDMYVGNSAKNMKTIFDAAKILQGPVVLFFDEFGSMGSNTKSGSVERQSLREVLRTELSNLKDFPNIIVAATANSDIDDFDPALVRAGRLEPLYVPVPTLDERIDVWAIVLCKQIRALDKVPATYETDHAQPAPIYANDINGHELAAHSEGLTGADMEVILHRIQVQRFVAEALRGEVRPITQADILAEIKRYQKP